MIIEYITVYFLFLISKIDFYYFTRISFTIKVQIYLYNFFIHIVNKIFINKLMLILIMSLNTSK